MVSGVGATWTSTSGLSVGNYGTGSLTIQDGGKVSSSTSYIGRNSGSSGTAVVSGTGASWTSTGARYVGYDSTGSLTIQDGGQVSNANGYLGFNSGSSGTAVVSGTGSTWTCASSLYVGDLGTGSLTVENGGRVSAGALYASLTDLHGNGIITASGGVLDADMVFDVAHGLSQTFAFGSSGSLNISITSTSVLGAGYKTAGSLWIADGRSITSLSGCLGYHGGSVGTAVVSGTGSKWTVVGLDIGRYGTGSLTVQNGGRVSSNWDGIIGYGSGSSGTAVVSGTGAKWTSTGNLYVGSSGKGSLTIQDGGQVSNSSGYIGYVSGSGTVVVSGIGSTWASTASLSIGGGGAGRLTLADGGAALTKSVSVNSMSSIRMNISGDGMLVLGTAAMAGSINNGGKVNFYADAFLAAGTYRPITEHAGRAITWSGLGAYNATGGAWDPAAKTFIVQPAVQLPAGDVAAVTTGQRLLVTDAASGKRVGASFPNVPAGTTLRADAMGDAELSALSLSSGEYILAAWDFDTNFTGSAMLAFDVGIVPRPTVPAGGASAEMDALTGGLKTYRLAGSSWTLLPAGDFIYAQTGIASFTTGLFGGFAITAVSAAGDADRDGQIDDDDLSLLLSNWNQPAGWTAGNFSGDGTVDDDDLSLLLSNWTGGPAPAVPEPATMALLALGAVGMLRRRPRASSGNR